MSIMRSLRRGSTTEVLNHGLESKVIEAKNFWRKRERVRGGEEVLSMIAKYTQVENALGLHLRYLEIL